ncbi:MAG: N-acetylmuramoyl-L-alanine amidase [Clostridia bacterium]|nr:N-acetylmuramoyl-L-alanine amidase [Clostridia bacterium]
MKKERFRKIFGLGGAILWLIAAGTVPIIRGMAEEPRYTVVVDPGHGGTDGGAVGDDGTVEKHLNLSIASLLKEKLEKKGITVIMTRQTDEDTDGLTGFHKRQDLEQRAKIGNESGADVYVSIHINASNARRDQGFQAWYGSGNPDGKRLAECITASVEDKSICTRIRAVKQVPETLYIFRTVTIPSVLVECGFISNSADLYQLKQEGFRNEMCEALCDGIVAYLTESNSRIT